MVLVVIYVAINSQWKTVYAVTSYKQRLTIGYPFYPYQGVFLNATSAGKVSFVRRRTVSPVLKHETTLPNKREQSFFRAFRKFENIGCEFLREQKTFKVIPLK